MQSISKKIGQSLKSDSEYKNLQSKVGIEQCREAGEKFKSILEKEIASSPNLSPDAVSSISNIKVSNPVKVKNNLYRVGVSFSGDLHRPSLAPSLYPNGIENIVALLNNGYNASDYVYGNWNGSKRIRSLIKREGAHFAQNSVRIFESEYGAKYNIQNIKINDSFK